MKIISAAISVTDNYVKKLTSLAPDGIIVLSMRIAIFFVFWNSVQTKIYGGTIAGYHFKFWGVTDSTITLFEYEYALPLLPVNIAAYMASLGEFFLSLAILFGFMTRLSALGLLIMTLVIQIFVYPESWSVHLLWASILLYLAKNGAGNISLEALIK